jgi:hypothetical protein
VIGIQFKYLDISIKDLYGLFYDTVSISGYTKSSPRTIGGNGIGNNLEGSY